MRDVPHHAAYGQRQGGRVRVRGCLRFRLFLVCSRDVSTWEIPYRTVPYVIDTVYRNTSTEYCTSRKHAPVMSNVL